VQKLNPKKLNPKKLNPKTACAAWGSLGLLLPDDVGGLGNRPARLVANTW
jgi:hypothetical protein